MRFFNRSAKFTAQVGLLGLALAGGSTACETPPVSSNGQPGTGNNPGTPGNPSNPGGPSIVAPPEGSGGNQTPSEMTPTENNNCGLKQFDLERRPADLLLVLDRSRSMLEEVMVNGAMVDKWTEAVGALDQVLNKTQATVSWGLKLFPMVEACGVPDGAEVPVALSNHMQVMSAITANAAGTGSGSSTPTRDAVTKGAAFLTGTPSTNAKYLLIATDGEPNCGSGGTRSRSDATATIAAVAAANAAGIPSYVIGVATSGTEADATLNAMATAGGRPRAGDTKYFPVVSRDELATALDSIATQVGSCTFPLNTAPPAPNNVAVKVDGNKVERNQSQSDGWNYGADNKSIVFHGPACEKLKTGESKDVQIILGCGTTPIP